MITMKAPEIEVGILSADGEIHFQLNGSYRLMPLNEVCEGKACATLNEAGQAVLSFEGKEMKIPLPVFFEPAEGEEETASFDLEDVVIGIGFHWERKERQRFNGKLKLMLADGKLLAVNVLSVEDYLLSVISSEMSATSSVELLKAHAVISRSWLLAQKEKSSRLLQQASPYRSVEETEDSYIRWYDREDHEHFDVCADDHCQRYQGITRQSTPEVTRAVGETAGEVLTFDGKLCDARFSKCCGGVTESFEHVWEPVVHPYLQRVVDNDQSSEFSLRDLKQEAAAREWILASPPAFCNTKNKKALSQILNDYDRETTDFFRWTVSYTRQELSSLIREKTGWDFGDILDLIPVERGESGRLIRLRIVGTKKTLTIGKELLIRKALAESHLYSSAFIVEKDENNFTLKGAGWGHGVGLCQIGAAMMGESGYTYREILAHYFRGAGISRRYGGE